MTDTPNLFSLVLCLAVAHDGSLPPRFGHQAHGMFLEIVSQVQPDLAEALHADGPSKPFTVAALSHEGRVAGAPIRAGEAITLRVTLLSDALFGPFTRALLAQTARPSLRLGGLALTLAEVRGTPGSHPWAGFGSFATLAADAPAAQRVALQFATPAAFSLSEDDGRKRVGVLPTPQAVFGSLLRRWNGLAPNPIDQALAERAIARALVADYDLRTVTYSLGKATQVGFVGHCTYELRGSDKERRTLATLAAAAFYLGVGMKTTRGMGLCRIM
jgi:CRISPR-associated endoribonuclease Cas6